MSDQDVILTRLNHVDKEVEKIGGSLSRLDKDVRRLDHEHSKDLDDRISNMNKLIIGLILTFASSIGYVYVDLSNDIKEIDSSLHRIEIYVTKTASHLDAIETTHSENAR